MPLVVILERIFIKRKTTWGMDGNIRKQWRDARNYGKFSVLIVVLEIIPGHGHRQPLKEGSVKHLFPSHILIPFKIPRSPHPYCSTGSKYQSYLEHTSKGSLGRARQGSDRKSNKTWAHTFIRVCGWRALGFPGLGLHL